MTKLIQPSFARGELSPALLGRVDTRAYQLGLRKARNVYIHQYGGVSNRPGTYFIGPVKDHTQAPRLIPFQFKTTDTHILEFGHEYIRIIRNDAHVTEAGIDIDAVSATNPVVVTTDGNHGYSNGDEVFISGVGGMTEITEQRWLVDGVTATTFELKDQVTDTDVDGTGFTAYTSGGTTARVYTLESPYQQADLRQLKYVQTADVITIVHPSYAPRELRRMGLANWALVEIEFFPSIDFPTTLSASGGSGTATSYKVTAISEDGEEESLSALGDDPAAIDITAITKANPAVVTTDGTHDFVSGDEIHIGAVTPIVGMTELNNRRFVVANPTGTTLELLGEDSTNYGTYISGGDVSATFVRHTADDGVTLSWVAVPGAVRYRIFQLSQGVFGYIASTEATTFETDANIVPDLGDTPPRYVNPFFGDDNRPGAVGFYQQRKVFGGSNNRPDTSFFSVVSAFNNFSRATPIRADDAITATLSSREVNEIRHYVSLRDLLVFTTGGEWLVNSAGQQRFSYDTIQQSPQSNWGSSHLSPLLTGNTVLFVTGSDRNVRGIKYRLDSDGYVSEELSLLVPHFFEQYTLVEWDIAISPEPIIYMVRSDGTVLVLTYNEEQEVIAWATWDTMGYYESVAVVQPSINDNYDAAYFVVHRNINGNLVRYIERTHSREFTDIRDAYFVDCGLTYDVPYSIEDVDFSDPLVITITDHPFTDGDEVDIYDTVWEPIVDGFGNFDQPGTVLNGYRFTVANATSNTFQLIDQTGAVVDGTELPVYLGGGTVRLAVEFVSGLFHLKNTAITMLGDGNVITTLTVNANGTLDLPRKFSRLQIGLPYISDIHTLAPEPRPDRTIQGNKKRIAFVTVKFDKSRGLWIGPNSYDMQEMKQREYEALGVPTAMLSGDKEIAIPPNWKENGSLFLRQLDPLPLTILAIIPDIDIGDR
jgi:hypothetical protein